MSLRWQCILGHLGSVLEAGTHRHNLRSTPYHGPMVDPNKSQTLDLIHIKSPPSRYAQPCTAPAWINHTWQCKKKPEMGSSGLREAQCVWAWPDFLENLPFWICFFRENNLDMILNQDSRCDGPRAQAGLCGSRTERGSLVFG